MKTLKLVTSLFLLFALQTLQAQYGQGGFGGNQMGNQMGGQRGNQMRSQEIPQTTREKPIEETVAKIVENLKKQLTLDELQVIAISNLITDNMKKQNVIFKKEGANEDKSNELKATSEKTDLDILILLNKEQKTKYKLLSEDNKNKQEAQKRNR